MTPLTFRCLTSCAKSCVFALKTACFSGKLQSAACRYVKSRSDPQLQGQIATLSSLKNCEPELYQDSHQSVRIDPCGLIAWSFFNDTYQVGFIALNLHATTIKTPLGCPRGLA